MKKTFILTFFTQLLVTLSGLLIFKLISLKFSEIGLADYSLAKRNITYLYTFFLLGLGVTVPKYIANKIAENSGQENDVFFAASLILLSVIFTYTTFFLLFSESVSYMLFGDKHFTNYIPPILFSITALLLHALVYAYYRGYMHFNIANLLQLSNLGFIPLFAIFLAKKVQEIFLFSGIMTLLLTIPILLYLWSKSLSDIRKATLFLPQLLKYSLNRLPADFGMASLLALPSIIAVHTIDSLNAGYIAFSISLLSISGHLVAPFGTIMLPKISYLLGNNDLYSSKAYAKKLLSISLFVGLSGLLIYQIFTKEILMFYLGNVSDDLISTSRKIMVAVVFYPVFVTMRSIVDAYYAQAYNTYSILLSLLCFFAIFLLTRDTYFSFVFALGLLAILTIFFLKPLLISQPKSKKNETSYY